MRSCLTIMPISSYINIRYIFTVIFSKNLEPEHKQNYQKLLFFADHELELSDPFKLKLNLFFFNIFYLYRASVVVLGKTKTTNIKCEFTWSDQAPSRVKNFKSGPRWGKFGFFFNSWMIWTWLKCAGAHWNIIRKSLENSLMHRRGRSDKFCWS